MMWDVFAFWVLAIAVGALPWVVLAYLMTQ